MNNKKDQSGKCRGRVVRRLLLLLASAMVMTVGFGWYYLEKTIPRHISIVVHEQENFSFALPFDVTLTSDSEEVVLQNQSSIPSDQIRLKKDEPFSLRSDKQGNYHLGMKLFGKITLREIRLDVVDTRYAVPCGVPVGIYLKSQGVMVIGTGRIKNSEGQEVEPAYGILQTGDYIEAINGKPLRDKEALITRLNQTSGSDTVLKVRRDGEEMEIVMNPVEAEDGNYKLGAWVRDDTQGIGTLTYMEGDGSFGALGHGISDSDTGRVVEIQDGSLYETEILGIEKGSAGDPGVMAGVIFYGPGSNLGTVEANTDVGIFGSVNERMKKTITSAPVEVGLRQDVHKGPALIRSAVSGEVKDYEIEIQRIEQNPFQKNKSLIIHITDSELIALTGGIIQGMSGSPILQDGKLIGAVTHVFVQDASRGYGILIEDMMDYDK
jgi:stage IV sporulation protein B